MKTILHGAALAALALGIAACGESYDAEENAAYADNSATYDANAAGGAYGPDGTATASADWPEGTRIVEEGGVTYRIDPDGTRVALVEGDSRIVVEDGVRFRVDPDGTRVRIDDDGLAIDVDDEVGGPDIDADLNLDDGDIDAEVNTTP